MPETPVGNMILDWLPPAERLRVVDAARRVSYRAKQDAYRLGDPGHSVLFPLDAVFSQTVALTDGRSVDVGLVDHEGILGLSAALGIPANLVRATAQVPGECLKIPADTFAGLRKDCTKLDDLTRRFVGFAWRTACQNTACAMAHPVEPRMCRWLLMLQDRARADSFPLTQETLSQMLGVSRQTVTVAAGAVQAAGLITYKRAKVTVVDRAALEKTSCECYQALRDAYREVMGFRQPKPSDSRAGS